MNTTSIGREAEALVAEYLKAKKHEILALNWRTRWCEIDIISKHKKCVYFVEVKFRSQSDWGSGLEYVTQKKLQQMKFAAEFWMHQNNWSNQAELCAAEVDKVSKISFTIL